MTSYRSERNLMELFIKTFANFPIKKAIGDIDVQVKYISVTYDYKMKYYYGTSVADRKMVVAVLDYYARMGNI